MYVNRKSKYMHINLNPSLAIWAISEQMQAAKKYITVIESKQLNLCTSICPVSIHIFAGLLVNRF